MNIKEVKVTYECEHCGQETNQLADAKYADLAHCSNCGKNRAGEVKATTTEEPKKACCG